MHDLLKFNIIDIWGVWIAGQNRTLANIQKFTDRKSFIDRQNLHVLYKKILSIFLVLDKSGKGRLSECLGRISWPKSYEKIRTEPEPALNNHSPGRPKNGKN